MPPERRRQHLRWQIRTTLLGEQLGRCTCVAAVRRRGIRAERDPSIGFREAACLATQRPRRAELRQLHLDDRRDHCEMCGPSVSARRRLAMIVRISRATVLRNNEPQSSRRFERPLKVDRHGPTVLRPSRSLDGGMSTTTSWSRSPSGATSTPWLPCSVRTGASTRSCRRSTSLDRQKRRAPGVDRRGRPSDRTGPVARTLRTGDRRLPARHDAALG